METDSKYLENKNCSKPCSVAVCITLLLSLLLPVQKNRLLADFTDILTQCPFQKSCRCSTEIRNPFPRHKRNRNCRKANQLLKNNLVRALQHTVSLPKLLSTGSASEAASQLHIHHCLTGTCIPLALFQIGDKFLRRTIKSRDSLHLPYTDPKHTDSTKIVGGKESFQQHQVRNMSKES